MAAGLYILRYRRRRLGLPRAAFRAWDSVIIFNIAVYIYLLVMPWYPPDGGIFAGDVSFWYATYVVTGLGMYVPPPSSSPGNSFSVSRSLARFP
jgi:hypothetical protein